MSVSLFAFIFFPLTGPGHSINDTTSAGKRLFIQSKKLWCIYDVPGPKSAIVNRPDLMVLIFEFIAEDVLSYIQLEQRKWQMGRVDYQFFFFLKKVVLFWFVFLTFCLDSAKSC